MVTLNKLKWISNYIALNIDATTSFIFSHFENYSPLTLSFFAQQRNILAQELDAYPRIVSGVDDATT